MTWHTFPPFALIATLLALAGGIVAAACPKRAPLAIGLTAAGSLVLAVFVVGFWHTLGRPPLRTMGETRLCYALLVMVAGLAVHALWRYRWLPLLTSTIAAVFCGINVLCPELHDATLMPALQSPWFVPHVVVYMLAYALFACATLLALVGTVKPSATAFRHVDNLVYLATAFLILGLLSGAVWAKEAWGDYWTWDPKETWAAITLAAYLAYIHLRLLPRRPSPFALPLLLLAFLLLQMCWYGYQYLPTSAASQHMYR